MIRIAFWLAQHSIHQWTNWIAGLYYVRHCLEAIASLPDEERPSVVAFAPESLMPILSESGLGSQVSWLTMVPISEEYSATPSGLNELAKMVESHQCDILFPAISPPCIPFKGRIIAWITDYQHKYYPEFFSQSELLYREQMFAFMTAISTRILCSSKAVQCDLYRFFPRTIGRGTVLRFATAPPDSVIRMAANITLKRLGIHEPYAYLPYQFWKHKNHLTAFKAWSIMASHGFCPLLVCSGNTKDSRSPEHFSSLTEYLQQYGLADRIRILGMVSRDDQWQLYRGAKLVLQPSLFEGWSTSVEEARSLGKPTVLSDIPVHREQLGDSGHFFGALNEEELAGVVTQLWPNLPEGYDAVSESIALAKNLERLQDFGRTLTKLFHEVMDSEDRLIGCDVLPLFLSVQQDASERLNVIQVLQDHIKYLEQCVSDRSESIVALEQAPTHNDSETTQNMLPSSSENRVSACQSPKEQGSWLGRVKRLFTRAD